MVSYLLDHPLSLLALIISISTFVNTQRGISKRVKADALIEVEKEITELNDKLEEEVKKLQKGLDIMIKERISLKEEITVLRKALVKANIEVEELRDGA